MACDVPNPPVKPPVVPKPVNPPDWDGFVPKVEAVEKEAGAGAGPDGAADPPANGNGFDPDDVPPPLNTAGAGALVPAVEVGAPNVVGPAVPNGAGGGAPTAEALNDDPVDMELIVLALDLLEVLFPGAWPNRGPACDGAGAAGTDPEL